MPKVDVTVLGAGLAGLLAAVTLSKSGKKVLVLDAAREPGGRAVHIDVSRDRYRSVPNPVYGLEREGVLGKLCIDAGIPDIPLKPASAFQVVLPLHRITVSPSVDETLNELIREFPLEKVSIRKLYRYAADQSLNASKSAFSSYLLRRRGAQDFLKSFSVSRDLYAFFDVQSRVYFGQPLTSLRLAVFVRMLTKPPRAPHGGYSWLAERLAERLTGSGGELRLNTPWPSLVHQGKRISGLRTGPETIETKAVILNAVETEDERRLLLELRKEAIPVEMKEAVCCLPDHRDMRSLFTLSLADQTSSRETTADTVMLSASFAGTAGESARREQLRERISDIMPFMSEFLLSEYEDEPAARTFPLSSSEGALNTERKREGHSSYRAGFRNLHVLPDGSALSGETLDRLQRILRKLM